jgi:RecJ-like exonuclease
MNLTELTVFCKSWGDLSTPFYHNHFVYATDGNLAIRIPAENLNDNLPEKGNRNVAEMAEKLDEYFAADYSKQESHTLSDFDFDLETELCEHCEGEGKLYACDECDGDGIVVYSTDYNDYEHECGSCNGDGYFTKSEWEREFPRSNVENADHQECEDCGGAGTISANPDIYFDEVRFQGKLLKKFMQFEGATITISKKMTPALIKWDGGEGILMPMIPRSPY